MKIHANAKLTVRQRLEVKRLHEEEGLSYRELARRFDVDQATIWKWIKRESPLDLSSAPKRRHTALSEEQKKAIRSYREANPRAGPITIAAILGPTHGKMSQATIGRFLKDEGLTSPRKKRKKTVQPLNVGRHRLQMDIQQLPAIEGGEKFEYKVTIIHMATRMKFSDIYPEINSDIVVQALQKALAHMPPFFFSVDG